MTASTSGRQILLRTITFQPDDSVVLEYCIPAQDARENGVILNHTMAIPYGKDYDSEIDAVHDAVIALIDDVLEDLPDLEPLNPSDIDDEDDEDQDDDDDDQ
jgi:hypothetical protein